MSRNEMPSAVRQIESELSAFREYCREQNISQAEIARMCAPLRLTKPRCGYALFVIITIIAAAYGLSYLDFFAWHFTAVGRILMIQMLPFYDWQLLKSERCLIRAPESINVRSDPDCYYCESLQGTTFSADANPDHLKKHYADLNVPVIFPHKIIHNFTHISQRASYATSIPCQLATNLRVRKRASVGAVLDSVSDHASYFLHFQNCDFSAVKEFRVAFPRPEFFADEYSPVQYSWILASKHYGRGKFKKIGLRDRLAAVVQLAGSNDLRLHPVKSCAEDCASLDIVLEAGEAVLLTELWDLEYKPGGDTEENIAVIFEAH